GGRFAQHQSHEQDCGETLRLQSQKPNIDLIIHQQSMEFTLGQLAALLGGKAEGDENQKVYRLDKIQEGKPGGISFLANEKYEPFLYETASTAVIVSEGFTPTKRFSTTLIRVEDAYLGFTKLLE